MPSSHPAQKYLAGRDISPKTIQEFGLGYADSSWDSLVSHLQQQGISMNKAMETGLVAEKSGRTYDTLRDRLIFPIFARNGKDVLGFGARALGEPKPQVY